MAQQITDLASGAVTSEELTQAYLDRIERHSSLGAYITVSDKALEQARDADQARAAGDQRPLLGIPIAHKDIFCTEGLRTTAASRILDNFVAPYSATVVEKLDACGVVTLGKTNMDEFAMGSSNENSHFGPARNPWNPDHVPGGSSGGSAVAVAAQLCAAATGTDTGGSIRQPAAFCGITGIKPTYGRVSRWGIIAYASSLDQAGPMGRTAEDCAWLLGAMSGRDARDSTSADHPVDDYVTALTAPSEGLRVGLCREYMEHLDPAMAAIVQDTTKQLESDGATLVDVSLPNVSLAIPAYYIIAPAECSANLSRYDGVRFGYRCESPDNLEDLYKRSRSDGFGQEVQNRIMTGTFALSAGYIDAYYHKAQQIRRLIKNDFLAAFQQVDVILAPATPGPAFRIGEKTDDANEMYQQDIFTISANLAGIPGLSMPAGSINDLPVGMQLLGPYFSESLLLQTAHRFQQATDWHNATPGPHRRSPDE